LSRLSAAEVDDQGRCVRILGEDKAARAAKYDGEDEALFHLRVSSSEGYFQAPDEGVDNQVPESLGEFNLVFLNDAGGAARSSPQAKSLLKTACGQQTVILHKMHLPLAMGSDLVQAVQASASVNKVLVITANDLRADGTRLRASLSWPLFRNDLSAAADAGVLKQALNIYNHVVVLVGEDGAFALDKAGKLTMAYDAGGAEGEHDANNPGDVYGKTNVFACALLKACAGAGAFNMTESALAQALATARAYSARCLTVADLNGASQPGLPSVKELADAKGLRTVASGDGMTVAGLSDAKTLQKARDIVLIGKSALADMEHARFGDFLTVDQTEIEGFRAIKSVIEGYVDDHRQTMPLSLGVFGPPGSGKSFGIKQLAKSRPEIEFRVFNLSEASADALPGYFHEMRDINLKGKVPLWFFDEFDSRKCELVARFLAPMQDGEMRDGTRLHPIGRGILVFAGGTAATAKQFSRDNDEARQLKIPDFVSRLAGIIDIRGINQVKDEDEDDQFGFRLRRAILLRSLLEKHRGDIRGSKPDELRVHSDLLDALLLTESYTHGARSMEKIVMAGALKGPRPIFGGSDLPGEGLLKLHLSKHEDFLAMATGKTKL
jgi:hypothetical protein